MRSRYLEKKASQEGEIINPATISLMTYLEKTSLVVHQGGLIVIVIGIRHKLFLQCLKCCGDERK